MNFRDDYTLTISGEGETAKNTFEAFNPATKDVIAYVPDATEDQLDRAVASARSAFGEWGKESIEVRQEALTRLADALEEHADDFMSLLTLEQGKPRAGAEWEITGSIDWLRAFATMQLPEEVLVDTPERRVVTRTTPLGVVGLIVPWNFPVILAVWKIAPALLAGNTIVLKPSPYTPLCTLKFGELFRKILPPGVLNVVSGGDELGKWITAHHDIDKIGFTGHTDTGKAVMRSASGTLKRITLELGGNDPAIILPDVDVNSIAPKIFWAAFQNCGQFCNAAKRIYIHEDIYDELRDALVSFVETVKVGDGADADTMIGPIQNKQQFEKLQEFFNDCRQRKLKFACGGEIDENSAGWFVPVTLVDCPPDDSRIVNEEPFGPILPLLKWRDEAEVIARANDSDYGLGASVWGNDLEAVQRIGSQLQAGTVWMNEIHEYSPFQAFAGHKQSGLGCENSIHGLQEYTNLQTIAFNKSAQ